MFTNSLSIQDHGVMLSDYFHGTSGVMLSLTVDNKTTVKQIIQAIKDEIDMVCDHIEHIAEYHNFRGNLEHAIDKELQSMKEFNKDRLNDIAFPELDFDFESQEEQEDIEWNEYPVLIISIEFNQDNSLPYPDTSNARKTGKSLQYAIENPEQFNGMDFYIKAIEENHIEQSIECFSIDISWLDYYSMPVKEDIQDHNIAFIHSTGYYLGYKIGDKKPDNTKMVFIGTLPLSEEIEEQADNGGLAYHYIGSNFLEVWVKEEFVDWTKIEEK